MKSSKNPPWQRLVAKSLICVQEACRGEDREQVGVNGRAGMSCALMKMLARRSPPTLRAERRAAVLLFARNRGWRCEGAGQCKVCVGLRAATHAQARSQCVSDFLRDAFVMAGLIGLHFSSVSRAPRIRNGDKMNLAFAFAAQRG